MRLLVDHNGTLWAATGEGLNRFDSLTGRFSRYGLDPQKTDFGLTLVEDHEGKIWIGTESSGLRHFDPGTGQVVIYEHNRDLPGTLSDNRVNSVHFDRSGTIVGGYPKWAG